MHKVNILSIFFVFILWSCGSSKSKAYPEYVIGTKNDSTQKMFPMDSLFIVTPNIQINKVLSYSSEPDYEKRKSIRDLVIEMLKYELLNKQIYNLPLMYEDYLTVNKVLEGLFYMGWKHPDWIVKAPDQILISEKKYTLLVSIHAHYGKRNSGIMSFSIINNKDKIIEYIKRSDFSDSLDRFNYIDNPLDVKQIRKRIKAVLKKMIY